MSFRSTLRLVLTALFFALVASNTDAQPRVSKEATIYTLTIHQGETKSRIDVTEVQRLKGDFKIPDLGKNMHYDAGMLVIKVTDARGNNVYETVCENPLDMKIESVDGRGNLTRTRVQQETGTVNLRVPFDTNGHTVAVYTVDSNQRLSLLSTF